MKGQSYFQMNKKQKKKLEYCHNLVAQRAINPERDIEYNLSLATVIARMMTEIMQNIMPKKCHFRNLYIRTRHTEIWKQRI